MYTILSTYPAHASGNVGDKLLEEQTKHLIEKETGVSEFEIYFRSRDFSADIDKLNKSDAIILPAFAIREPLHPDTYALTENLDDIEVPLIPIASNWTHYPGDAVSNNTLNYKSETVSLIKKLDQQSALDRLTTRDIYTKNILERHGFDDVTLVGDLGWYHDDYLGEPMRVPDSIDHVVMTTPHNAHYVPQAEAVMDMLISEFPDATLTCSFHSSLSPSDQKLRRLAQERGFEIVLASHNTDNLEFYDECDLHVGYRLHGHISFLRRRLPSVLIGEDGRGNGFNATLGVGGFQATNRRLTGQSALAVNYLSDSLLGKGINEFSSKFMNKPNLSKRVIAPADMNVPQLIRQFLQKEMENEFESYSVVPEIFDQTYENNMKPFLKSLP